MTTHEMLLQAQSAKAALAEQAPIELAPWDPMGTLAD